MIPFFSNFTHKIAPFSHALFWSKYVQTSNFYFLTLLSSFSSKNSIGDFDLFSFWQWSCRNLYCHFFTNKNSLLLYPFWSKYLGNTIFWYFLYAHNLLLKNKKKSEIFSFFSKIQCIHCFFWTISKKPKTSCSHALLEGVFVTVLQSYCRVKSLFQSIIAWLGVILKYLSPEHLGNHTDGASKIWKIPICSKNYRICENHPALTTNFCLQLGKG